MNKYIALPQTGLSEEDAQIIGETIERLATDSPITPGDLLAEAKFQSSPIHGYFEWDDARAGHMWRIEQARGYLRAIQIIPADTQEPIRAFHHVTVAHNNRIERGYVTLGMVMKSGDLMEQIIKAAAAELESWRNRHKQYRQLAAQVAKVSEVIESLRRTA